MKQLAVFFFIIAGYLQARGQNVGIGTNTPTENLHVVGNKTLFENNFVGIGAGAPVTGYTQFQVSKNVNTFLGMYINAGATGTPFYGYALNGTAKAYMAFNGTAGQFEYHQSGDAVADFLVNGNTKAVFNTAFVGIGTSTPTTAYTGFAMKSAANSFYGSYIDAGATGTPFYGYALNGTATAYTAYNGPAAQFEYHHTSDAIPDFFIGNTNAAFPNAAFLGIGTSTATNGFTGITLKKNSNSYWGMYVDAGAAGRPFYGYALNGSPIAYSQYNGSNNNWELVTNSTTAISVSAAGNVGIGVNPAQKLDVAGTIHASNLNGGATSLSTDAAGNIIRTPSDMNLKNDISDITGALDKVERMHGVTYDFKDKARFGTNRQMGFLAQELEQVVPEAVSSGGEYKSVNYQVLTALIAAAVKEQQAEITKTQKENMELKGQVQELLERIKKLEKK